ncbi:hypothetical protein ASAC_0168 [Acidilobus saccharovorans 345-15]|uniref:DedA family protein n=1 Tax=Acidilobus saccharovorans (strain DSM 16705 / JCM 18335 / VKM B-2471 / 345-15) TaxID=666510 RepID=D9PZT8_ACIS3|nr:hypothetical protein ASAC_0168 [Acidilobus saccharovorans 345-15]
MTHVSALAVIAASFSVALLFNLIPLGAPPYVTVVLLEIKYGGLGFWPPVLAASLGAAIAKVVMYYLGVGLKGVLRRNRNVRFLARYSNSRWAYLLAFFAAVVPVLPLDDFVYMVGGASGMRAKLMGLIAAAAKLLKTVAETSLLYFITGEVSMIFRLPEYVIIIFMAAAGLVAGLIVFSLDWELLARRLGLLREP